MRYWLNNLKDKESLVAVILVRLNGVSARKNYHDLAEDNGSGRFRHHFTLWR